MNTCKTGCLGNNNLCLCLFLFYRVCKNERLEILEMSLCVYVCVVAEGMYTCKTGHFVNLAFVFMFVFLYTLCTHVRLGISGIEPLCLCFWCSIGYLYM